MNHIKNIFEKNIDEWTHKKFIRYGLGQFEKETFFMKKTGKGVTIQAGHEYLDVIFDFLSGIIDEDVPLKGVIVTKKKILPELQAQGIEPEKVTGKKYTIDITLNPAKFKEFVKAFNQYALLLNLKSPNYVLKLKKSIPKPGKLVEKFLTAKLPKKDYEAAKKLFLFDNPGSEFKTVEIKHTYIIDKIDVPKQYENDPAQARLKATRKGKIKRLVNIDGKTTETEIEMNV